MWTNSSTENFSQPLSSCSLLPNNCIYMCWDSLMLYPMIWNKTYLFETNIKTISYWRTCHKASKRENKASCFNRSIQRSEITWCMVTDCAGSRFIIYTSALCFGLLGSDQMGMTEVPGTSKIVLPRPEIVALLCLRTVVSYEAAVPCCIARGIFLSGFHKHSHWVTYKTWLQLNQVVRHSDLLPSEEFISYDYLEGYVFKVVVV